MTVLHRPLSGVSCVSPLALSGVFGMRCERRRRDRQLDAKDRTSVGAAFGGDAPAVDFDRPLGNGQPEPGATAVPRSGLVEAEEPIEDPLAIFWSDPRPF